MRSISALSTVLAAAALVLGLASCGKSDNTNAKATSTTAATTARATTTTSTATTTTSPGPITTSPAPITTTAAAPEPTAISCGIGPFGLGVFAITTNGTAACPIALAVANAYAVQSDLWDPAVVIPVTVGTSVWDCQERIGAPNPYQECVSRDNPAEKTRLTS